MRLGRLMRRAGDVVSVPRVAFPVLSIAVCLALLAALMPAAVVSAAQGKPRQYMVTLDVADSGRLIKPSNKIQRTRIRQRAKRADEATKRIGREHGVKATYSFSSAVTGFAATMTPAQAAELAADPDVASIRLARTFELAAQGTPWGILRVKGPDSGTWSGGDVDAHVAVLDTGIGYSKTSAGTRTGEPATSAELNSVELNIRGGVNCYDDPWTTVNEAAQNPEWWADTHGHGTHVAGIIGARDNNRGVIGVAPGAKLWSVRVFEGEDGTEASIVCGLDWVIDRVNNGGRIDVVNMSIEGPRLDQREHCPTVLADADGDPIQQGICTLTSMGVTVVAAAGNDRMDANKSSPGGFDEVISVGAMTDTDGSGWANGPKTSCGSYNGEKDDTFAASYSNRGNEIDIVAPGTCVASLSSWDPDGDSLRVMTGTSMAAPHVTGAVARYVAAKGSPSSTGEMRKLVRAAGRMDWTAKSDPNWSGVNDSDLPNRVLDVTALSGGAFLRPWLQHQSFKVGGDDKTRVTRVDIQRGGEYSGTANLSVTGLPSSVGSASFGDASLAGLSRRQLGTNVTLKLKTSGSDGVHTLKVKSNGSGVSEDERKLTLTVDRTGPVVSGLATKIRGGNTAVSAKGATQTYLQWASSDALSSVKKVQLQRKIDGSAWRAAGIAGSSSSRVSLKPGQSNKFRVKATDSLGNVSYSGSLWTKLTIRDSSSSRWLKPANSGWQTKKADKAHKGSFLMAKGSTAILSTTFSGRAIALMASVGPSRGTMRVRVDGGTWDTVDLQANKGGHRKVVWSRKLDKGTHTLEVQGVDGQSTLDALLILA